MGGFSRILAFIKTLNQIRLLCVAASDVECPTDQRAVLVRVQGDWLGRVRRDAVLCDLGNDEGDFVSQIF